MPVSGTTMGGEQTIVLEDYIGDGVYVTFDGYHIWLDLRGQDSTTRIALEPAVLDALNRFRDRINAMTSEQLEAAVKEGA